MNRFWQRYWGRLTGGARLTRITGCDQEPVPHEHYPCCDHCLMASRPGQCMFRDEHHDPCARCQ